ncbi:MAG: class I SAM-dependent methyltransferase [archaeon]|nr:class I SAM-dependent methyltransferase [archaeon]
MKDEEVGKYWNENAENWTKLARLGYDRCRDLINSPGFFSILPDISKLKGLDVGCGEGYNTRIAAKKGALMYAIDISETFIKYAVEIEKEYPLNIKYQIASANHLPYPDHEFDFVIATMSLMDIANLPNVLKGIFRVIKPGGFFQFSITHPCFSTPRWEWILDEQGRKTALIVGDYFNEQKGEIEEWIFAAAPKKMTNQMPKFKVPRFNIILSKWLNLLIKSGFILEEFLEPKPDAKTLENFPEEYDSLIIPHFLIIRCRKKK